MCSERVFSGVWFVPTEVRRGLFFFFFGLSRVLGHVYSVAWVAPIEMSRLLFYTLLRVFFPHALLLLNIYGG